MENAMSSPASGDEVVLAMAREAIAAALEDRCSLAQDIQDACDSGARLKQVCDVAGIDERTLQRWSTQEGLTKGDGRPTALRPTPSYALSADERAKLVNVVNEGVYLASESTFARVLRAQDKQPTKDTLKPQEPNAQA
jgi:putative transposase